MVLRSGYEVGHGETHDWGGQRATPDPVGVGLQIDGVASVEIRAAL
jgi:hypothetical protein